MVRATKNLWVGVAFAAIAAATSPMVANAQGAGAEPTLSVSIPAQRLSDALRQLAETSHLQLIYDSKITDGKTSPGVSGAMTSRAALAQLLAGSGLGFRFSGDRTVTIAAATPGVRAVGVVNVEGAGSDIPNGEMVSPVNGINGSTDVEATEGTGSYTTGAASIVSKTPQSLRETPQSVSVITQQRISDEGLQSLESVLDVLPGLTVTQGSINTEFQVYSRGFQVVSYAFDGGAPLNFGLGNRPVIDLSEFDSAQLIRGADGLFGGYGDPGGFVNLERKKPLDHDQVEYSQDIGSFSNYREEADATGPLTADGKLKGRIAVAQQDENFFYKVANTHKTSIYGILEYDFTPNLIVNVGANYLTEKSITNGGGLPRYSNGAAIDWPVSTCLCEPYDYDKTQRREVFVGIIYKFNNDLSTKFNFTYNNQQIDQIYWGLESTIAPGATPATATPANGQATAYLLGYLTENPNKSYSFDDATTGKFKVFGLEQQFVVGGNYVYYDLDGGSTTYPSVQPFIPDVFQFNPSLYPEPAYQPPDYTTPVNRETTYGVYGNAKLELIKGFHLMLGIRESGYSDKQNGVAFGFPYVTPPLKDTSHSSLNVGATYDIFKNFTVYASHESIYLPQSETRYTQGGNTTLPPPITGVNDEAGVKWQSTDKLLNASLAFFSSLENGLEQTNYANPGSNIPVIDNRKSSGLEFEVTGQMLPGLQGSFSFARAVTKDTTSYNVQPLTSFVPPNKIKSFAVYRPQGSSLWSHFLFGGGVDWQSSAYTLSDVCLDNPPSPFGCSNYAAVPLTAKAYATLKLKVGYRFNRNLELSADANNVTNVKAYSPLQFSNPANYNFYTAPFNFLVSLRAKW